jgi:hypothetical protein
VAALALLRERVSVPAPPPPRIVPRARRDASSRSRRASPRSRSRSPGSACCARAFNSTTEWLRDHAVELPRSTRRAPRRLHPRSRAAASRLRA